MAKKKDEMEMTSIAPDGINIPLEPREEKLIPSMLPGEPATEEDKRHYVSREKKKEVLTLFLMLFPSLIITGLVTGFAVLSLSIIAIALFFYQAVIIKNFLDDYYFTYID